jgi:hypothetical protein
MLPLAEGKPDVRWRKEWLYEYYEYPGLENVRPCRGVRTERFKLRLAALRAQTNDAYQYKSTGLPLHGTYGTQSESGLVKQKNQ